MCVCVRERETTQIAIDSLLRNLHKGATRHATGHVGASGRDVGRLIQKSVKSIKMQATSFLS